MEETDYTSSDVEKIAQDARESAIADSLKPRKLFTKMFELSSFTRDEEENFEPEYTDSVSAGYLRPLVRATITVRRQISSFEETIQAADDLKRGDITILNFSDSDIEMREKSKNFLYGFIYGIDGTLEEISENVFLLATSYVAVNKPTALSSGRADSAGIKTLKGS